MLSAEGSMILQRAQELGLLNVSASNVTQIRRLSGYEQTLMAPPVNVESVNDLEIEEPERSIPLRIYTPPGKPPFPTTLFIHGGGWITGSIDHSDSDCRQLCLLTHLVVFSVGYRLAPEHKFPVGLDDAFAAGQWIELNARQYGGDPDRMFVAGG
jgi:acetyl esterase